VTDKEQPTERGAFAMFGALTGIATLSAVLVVGGAGVGLLIDDWTSAPHVFVFVGLVLGVVGAVLATRSIVMGFFR
jgi:F0F1-type ATP synthase assembly protein I